MRFFKEEKDKSIYYRISTILMLSSYYWFDLLSMMLIQQYSSHEMLIKAFIGFAIPVVIMFKGLDRIWPD